MGYAKFKTDALKRPRRRSKTAGTGDGKITTEHIKIFLDKKTIVFVKDKADEERVRKKWAAKQLADDKAMHRIRPDAPSLSKEYKEQYVKDKAKQNRERSKRKKLMGPF